MSTPNFQLPTPSRTANPPENVDAAIDLLIAAMSRLDIILKGQADGIAGKADNGHTHAISGVTGLSDALAGKMASNKAFKLADLTDVTGADVAPAGYVLVKTEAGWVVQSAAAAIGAHKHPTADVNGLDDALAAVNRSIDGGAIHAATEKTTLVDADELGISDSAASGWRLKRITWANIKATLKTYLDALYAPVGRTISAGGIATGGGTLAANRTITVPKADQATAIAGVDDTMAMTPVRTIDTINSRKVLTAVVPTTSGAAIDLTGIPSWAKKITMVFDGVSVSAGSRLLAQLGNGGIVSMLNYTSTTITFGTSTYTPANSTTGFEVGGGTSTSPYSGTVVLTQQADFTWIELGMVGRTDTATTNNMTISTGSKTLSSALNRVRLTTAAGAATFTGGSVALLIE